MMAGGAVGAAALAPALLATSGARGDPVPGGTLDPTTIPKYAADLFVLPTMPPVGVDAHLDRYRVSVRPHLQRVLPSAYPMTPVFAYGTPTLPATFHWPGYAIEARADRPVEVTWLNELVDGAGNFVPSLFTTDPTLHWANPPGGVDGRDSRPVFTSTPGPYRGPMPFVTHLHGAHVTEESDGYPEAWYLPVARNIPAGYARVGSFYDQFAAESHDRYGLTWPAGGAIFHYRNDQRATTLWYHGHELGMTRIGMYSGLAGFYLLRGGTSDLPPDVLPGGRHELAMMIQDRSFNTDGTLFFPDTRGTFGDTPPDGPWIPTTDVSPFWNPEFFGNTMVVNGRTWPRLTVAPRRYRFRLLNSSNARTVFLKIVTNPLAARPARARLPFWIIGSDGGFLPAPVQIDFVRLGVSERADVIVDFTGLPEGTELFVINEGPDSPYGGGTINVDYDPADPGTTGQVMKFIVGPADGQDNSVPPSQLHLPRITPIGAASNTRVLSLNEMDSTAFPEAPTMAMLGLVDAAGNGMPKHWMDPVTETPALGATEIWQLHNFTEDGHPIHLHQVQFQVVSRQPFGGAVRGPERWEHGFKDTLIALPGEITRLRAKFDIAGLYVWHCHIVDHEDNEMMRPYRVG